jgi:hypothetical protein
VISFGWFYSDEPLCNLHLKKKVKSKFTFTLNSVTFSFLGDFKMLLPVDKKLVGCTISYVDSFGNAAKVDGIPVWAADNPNLVTVIASTDGFSADIIPVGPVGTTQITVTADADLGEGVKTLTTIGTIECIAAEAVSGTINFPEPTPV